MSYLYNKNQPADETISSYIKNEAEIQNLKLQELWQLMDEVWDNLECDQIPKNIDLFYNHSIWQLNGLFIEQDKQSLQHRHAIVEWINTNLSGINSIIDYGGGFGTLARMIAQSNQKLSIDIYEPHPSQIAKYRVQAYPNLKFIDSRSKEYDCLISTDVLEHVPFPLELFGEMITSVKCGGHLIIANCFYPVIKCHLPITFHLRYTFNIFAKIMGLKVVGKVAHACIYQKVSNKSLDWNRIRNFEKLSQILFPAFTSIDVVYKPAKKSLKKILGKSK